MFFFFLFCFFIPRLEHCVFSTTAFKINYIIFRRVGGGRPMSTLCRLDVGDKSEKAQLLSLLILWKIRIETGSNMQYQYL